MVLRNTLDLRSQDTGKKEDIKSFWDIFIGASKYRTGSALQFCISEDAGEHAPLQMLWRHKESSPGRSGGEAGRADPAPGWFSAACMFAVRLLSCIWLLRLLHRVNSLGMQVPRLLDTAHTHVSSVPATASSHTASGRLAGSPSNTRSPVSLPARFCSAIWLADV